MKAMIDWPTHSGRNRFTVEYLAALERETSWVIESDGRRWPTESGVSTGAIVCPVCDGKGTRTIILRGETTGVPRQQFVNCHCQVLQRFHQQWVSKVPDKFLSCRLGTVVPRYDRQAKALKRMKEHPHDSFYLFGESRAGKTHLSYCLAHTLMRYEVLAQAGYRLPKGVRQPKVWIVRRTGALLDDLQALRAHRWSDDGPSPKIPEVTPGMIETAIKQGLRPVIVLQEIDRWTLTSDRMERLQELLDTVCEANGQIIATGNLSPDQLEKKWGETDAQVVIGRIAEKGLGHALQF